ncbi:MAG: glycosyltransferase family 2 protein, partial [Patescibacteria group bacterium]
MLTLSIIIPVYNEKATLEKLLAAVEAVKLKNVKKELVIVDDGSNDGTPDVLKNYESKYRVIYHSKNIGKGAALRTGFAQATGDFIVIQDADLEYDPNDYEKMIKPLTDGRADVVYGSRFIGSDPHRVLYFWHYLANRLLTTLSNSLTDLNLTDMETCYKMFSKDALKKILPALTSDKFGIEP